MWSVRRREAAVGMLGVCLCLAAGIIGCGSGEAKAPNPTRSIEERRAVELIERAMRAEGAEPAPGREETVLGTSKTMRIDVGVQNKRYGVAFITLDEADALGDAIPTPNHKDEKLKLKRLSDDGGTHVLLLFQQNYRYDDLAGEAHEQTTITAEASLVRDVRDFMVYARAKRFE